MKTLVCGDCSISKKRLEQELANYTISKYCVIGETDFDKMVAEMVKEKGERYEAYFIDWKNLTHDDCLERTNKSGNKYDARAPFRRNKKVVDEVEQIIVFGLSKTINDILVNAAKVGKEVIRHDLNGNLIKETHIENEEDVPF